MDPNKYTSSLVGYDFGFRGRPLVASLATPHGTAAALKAEAPQPAYGPDAAPVSWWHVIQRSNRKAANRRKARRGWR